MKRVKLMLLSLSILAVVGGTLAFTAKAGAKFCTATPDSGSCIKACPDLKSITSTTDANIFVCTALTNGNSQAPCNGVQCANKVNKTFE